MGCVTISLGVKLVVLGMKSMCTEGGVNLVCPAIWGGGGGGGGREGGRSDSLHQTPLFLALDVLHHHHANKVGLVTCLCSLYSLGIRGTQT